MALGRMLRQPVGRPSKTQRDGCGGAVHSVLARGLCQRRLTPLRAISLHAFPRSSILSMEFRSCLVGLEYERSGGVLPPFAFLAIPGLQSVWGRPFRPSTDSGSQTQEDVYGWVWNMER